MSIIIIIIMIITNKPDNHYHYNDNDDYYDNIRFIVNRSVSKSHSCFIQFVMMIDLILLIFLYIGITWEPGDVDEVDDDYDDDDGGGDEREENQKINKMCY